MRFYMTYARSRPDTIVPYAEENDIGLMTNAAHRWSDARQRFNHLWDYDCPHIVDSSGYGVQFHWVKQFLTSSEKKKLPHYPEFYATIAVERAGFLLNRELSKDAPFYPWTVDQYHEWLGEQYRKRPDMFDWAACMDYACERRFDQMWTVEDRVDRTVENTARQFGLDPDYPLIPVLQGRSVDQYVDCYERFVELGVPVEKVGLGTVCRISSTRGIVETERRIRERCPRIEEIHGFGVKIDAFRMGATFDSADSQAWVWAASNGDAYVKENGSLSKVPMDDSKKRTVTSFKEYYKHVMSMV